MFVEGTLDEESLGREEHFEKDLDDHEFIFWEPMQVINYFLFDAWNWIFTHHLIKYSLSQAFDQHSTSAGLK